MPPGITIECLADAPAVPAQLRPTSVALARYTYQPGATLDLTFPGAVVVYVETGTLTLEHLGQRVAVASPPEAVDPGSSPPIVSAGGGIKIQHAQQGDGSAVRQTIEPPPAGSMATLDEGGSVEAPDGVLGPSRNAAEQPLVLLVVTVVADRGRGRSAESTAPPVPTPATPAPSRVGR